LLARLSFALQQTEFKSIIERQLLRDEILNQAESIDKIVAAASATSKGN
jgi:hypothetical protein